MRAPVRRPAAKRPAPPADDTEKHLGSLRKLWLVLSLTCLVISLNVLAATQGGEVTLGIKEMLGFSFAKDTPEAIAALWGILYLSVFTILANAVMWAHAAMSAERRAERVPFRLFDLPPGRGVGLAAQWLAVLLLVLAPIYMLGHSWDNMLKHGKMCVDTNTNTPGLDDWETTKTQDFFLYSGKGPVRLGSDGALKDPVAGGSNQRCTKMADYSPPLQTWGMLALSLLATAVWVGALDAVLRPHRSATKA